MFVLLALEVASISCGSALTAQGRNAEDVSEAKDREKTTNCCPDVFRKGRCADEKVGRRRCRD